MSNRPRNTETKRTKWVPVGANSYPNIEEYRTRNREYRAKKRQELAEQIADRVKNYNMNHIQSITDRIYNIAKDIKLIKASNSYPAAKREKVSIKIIELQNHIHELQTYLVHLEETAIGMHD